MSQNSYDPFVNRRKLLAILRLMVRQRRQGCLLTIEAPEDMGKSFLLRQMKAWCDRMGTPCALVDLANGRDEGLDYKTVIHRIRHETDFDAFAEVATALAWQPPPPTLGIPLLDGAGGPQPAGGTGPQADKPLGSYNVIAGNITGTGVAVGAGAQANVSVMNVFQTGEETEKIRMERVTQVLIETLSALTQEQVWVLLFDSYERRLPQMEMWLDGQFLPRLAQGKVPRLLVIMAGRERLPELRPKQPMSAARLELERFDLSIVTDYLKKRNVDLTRAAQAFRSSLHGIPGRLSIIVDGYVAEVQPAAG